MKILFFIILIFLSTDTDTFSQTDSLFEKEIEVASYRFVLTANDNSFFTGSLQIFDKYNNSVFYADSFFSRYNWDSLIDLNNDGNKELILDLGSGATMYDYNMFLVFDFTRKEIEPLEIHNAEIVQSKGEVPKILSYVRLSPAVMGAGYAYTMRYENGMLVLENDMSKSKALKELDTDGSDDLHLINEFEDGFDECADNSGIDTYYEAFLIQQKILGQEKKGWKFFDKNYKCSDKKSLRANLKRIVDEAYSYISNPDNYKFNTNNY
ncbi:MAG: hypothetical protein ABI528_04200 [bacterium]